MAWLWGEDWRRFRRQERASFVEKSVAGPGRGRGVAGALELFPLTRKAGWLRVCNRPIENQQKLPPTTPTEKNPAEPVWNPRGSSFSAKYP